MLNVGTPEMLVILVVALLILGPQKLPEVARQVGRAMSEIRRLGAGFQAEIRDAMQEPVRTEPEVPADHDVEPALPVEVDAEPEEPLPDGDVEPIEQAADDLEPIEPVLDDIEPVQPAASDDARP